ncbi:MAG: hypothetical protein JSS83_20865 [Cyanobacteria bacterium SZAS LIN-3]|nr:hypothetical protein [Cyanobacteria bacterium SZAS LIN-3]MBS2010600.1 hypothetical protein [Cyanobacteria bacterium SZAS TMP-1]
MCLSNNSYPSVRVSFDDTILLGLEVKDPTSGLVEHVVGYYNKVSARKAAAANANPDFGWDVKPAGAAAEGDFGWDVPAPVMKVGNAMLIAVPAEPGTVSAKSLVAVGKYPAFMEDYKKAVVPRRPVMRGSRSFGSDALLGAKAIVVKGFDGGTYDVVIASSAGQISSVIAQVDEAKRPQLNAELYKQLDLLYPGFTFVLFCFSEEDTAKSGCAVVKYQPRKGTEHLLYLPGLDGHNGQVETGEVELNHTLVVGSYRMGETVDASDVAFSDAGLRQEYPFFLDRVVGKVIPKGTMAPQGDFLFSLDEVRKGVFRAKRQLPPNWSKVFGTKGVPATPYFIKGSAY